MIKLRTNASYTNNVSDLAIKILAIRHTSDTYVKVKCIIFNKKDGTKYGRGMYWDKPEEIKLYYDKISDWIEFRKKHKG